LTAIAALLSVVLLAIELVNNLLVNSGLLYLLLINHVLWLIPTFGKLTKQLFLANLTELLAKSLVKLTTSND
jgi:hypothetical protein